MLSLSLRSSSGLTPSSREAKAGIAAGDLITAVNGKKMTSLADLQALLAQLTPGNSATVAVTDQNNPERTVTVVLGQLQG